MKTFMTLVMGFALACIMFVSVGTGILPMFGQDTTDLSVAAITVVPEVTLNKYRAGVVVIDFRNNRAFIEWDKGLLVEGVFVARARDSYEWKPTSEEGEVGEGEVFCKSKPVKDLLNAIRTVLVDKGKL